VGGGQDFEQEVQPTASPSLTAIMGEIERSAWAVLTSPVRTVDEDWKPQMPPQKPEDVILCRVVELAEGSEAVCALIAGGYEIPRVSFPAWVLRQKGLQVGSRFNWLVRDPDRVRPSDIDTNVAQADDKATVDLARLEALHTEMEQGLTENGGRWPVYIGDGE
jgi:hypothetical protein